MIKFLYQLTYMENSGEQLFRNSIKKFNINIRKEVQVKLVVTYNTTRLSFLLIRKVALANIFFCCLSFLLPGMSPRLYWKKQREHFGKNK